MHPCPDIGDWEVFAQDACHTPCADELARHLEVCSSCRGVLDRVRHNDSLLRALRPAWLHDGDDGDAAVPIGRRIGCYEITGLLGSGGMATVYSARQENPRRTVALKVLRPGLASRAALRRLEHEAELLGRLQHPGIARIYEAGYSDMSGTRQPFFAMELVEGERLLEFADRRRLGTRERLDLMLKIGESVHFAHQKGIIHRDLKPGNILVTELAEDPNRGARGAVASPCMRSVQPKVLDFGVARCTDSDLQTTTLQTDVGQLVGTIPYMSPEQALGDPSDIDVRSDVYALGVVTYELLTGRLPYKVTNRGVAAALQTIREEEPPPLSQTNRLLRGDIQTIVAKALEKDKSRRYSSAAEFVADLRRFLSDEPISARPASTAYQIAKFTKRNKALVTGIAGVFLALCAGLIGTGWGMVQARQERNRAEKRRAEAETVTGLLTEMLRSADPNRAKGADYTVRQLLDEFSTGLDSRFAGQEEVEATVRSAIGNAYLGLGLRPEARPHLEAALALRQQALGAGHAETARSLHDLGWWRYDNAELSAAEESFREALRIQRERLSPDDPHLADTLNSLAETLRFQGNHAAAEPLVREAMTLRAKVFGTQSAAFSDSLHILGRVLHGLKRHEEAESVIRESLAALREVHGDAHPDAAILLRDLAQVLVLRGDLAGAGEAFEQSLAMGRSLLGPEHHDVAITESDYGGFLSDTERYAAAETYLGQAVANLRRVHGDTHACVGCSVNRLCVVLTRMEEFERAEPVCREAVRVYEETEAPPQLMTQFVRRNLALCLLEVGRTAEALDLSQRALAAYSDKGETRRDETLAELNRVLGLSLLRIGDMAAAEPLLRDSVLIYREQPDSQAWRGAVVRGDLGECLTAMEQWDEAETLLNEAYDTLQRVKGPLFAETRKTLKRLVELHEKRGAPRDAERYRRLLLEAETWVSLAAVETGR